MIWWKVKQVCNL